MILEYILTLEFGTFSSQKKKKNLELLEVMNSFVWFSLGTVKKESHKPFFLTNEQNEKKKKKY